MKRPPKPETPKLVLTPAQEEVARQWEEMERKKKQLQAKYHEDLRQLKASAPKCIQHVWRLPDKVRWDWWGGEWHTDEGVWCAICGKDGGFYCPVNFSCEYDRDDENGGEDCIHCGAPHERK